MWYRRSTWTSRPHSVRPSIFHSNVKDLSSCCLPKNNFGSLQPTWLRGGSNISLNFLCLFQSQMFLKSSSIQVSHQSEGKRLNYFIRNHWWWLDAWNLIEDVDESSLWCEGVDNHQNGILLIISKGNLVNYVGRFYSGLAKFCAFQRSLSASSWSSKW